MLSLREPSDFAGPPVVGHDGVRMEPPDWARRLKEAGSGYLFLDELSTATPAMRAAVLGLARARRAAELQLPRGVLFFARPIGPSARRTAGTSARRSRIAS